MNSEPNPILACTVCRDVQNFDLLIVDMEDTLGDQWGDLGFQDAMQFFNQPEATHLEFIALAIDDLDEDNLDELKQIIDAANAQNVKTILIAEDVTPTSLHQLLRHGAHEFVPYPLPKGELQAAIDRIRLKRENKDTELPVAQAVSLDAKEQTRNGVIIAVHGLCTMSG